MMIAKLIRWTFYILLFATFTSCVDLINNAYPESDEQDSSEISFNNVTWDDIRYLKGEIDGIGLETSKQSDYACLISYDEDFSKASYTYEARWLHFPPDIIAEANGEVYTIFYTLSLEYTNDVYRFARCTIPASERAVSFMIKALDIENQFSTQEMTQGDIILDCIQVVQSVIIYELDGSWYSHDGYTCIGEPIDDDTQEDPGEKVWGDPSGGGGGGGGSGDGSGSDSDDNWSPDGNDNHDPCSNPDSDYLPASCMDIPETPCEGNPLIQMEIAPTSGQGISGGRYGAHRNHGDTHKGLDLKADLNSNVFSMYNGTVFAINKNPDASTFGKYIILEHQYNGEQIFILYAHLNKVNVTQNQFIASGFNIGLSGNTGNAGNSIPHLHIEVRKYVRDLGFNNAPHFDPENYITTKFDQNGNAIPNHCYNF